MTTYRRLMLTFSVLLAAAGCQQSANEHASEKVPGGEAQQSNDEIVDLTFEEFLAQYKEDVEKLNAEYKGKRFELTGEVTHIDRSLSSGQWRIVMAGIIPVTLETENPWNWIVPGQQVTVRAVWRTDAAGFMQGEIVSAGSKNAATVISSEELAARYNSDNTEVAKDLDFKWLEIKGEVVAIETELEVLLHVYLKGDDRSRIDCVFSLHRDGVPGAKRIKVGDMITLVGQSYGRSPGSDDISISESHRRENQSNTP